METDSQSPTAIKIVEMLNATSKKQREIAKEVGFNSPNVISMLKSGDTKMPMERIKPFAEACGQDWRELFHAAMKEYQPDAYALIGELLGNSCSASRSSVSKSLDRFCQKHRLAVTEAVEDDLKNAIRAVLNYHLMMRRSDHIAFWEDERSAKNSGIAPSE